jgi:hypothetical protein
MRDQRFSHADFYVSFSFWTVVLLAFFFFPFFNYHFTISPLLPSPLGTMLSMLLLFLISVSLFAYFKTVFTFNGVDPIDVAVVLQNLTEMKNCPKFSVENIEEACFKYLCFFSFTFEESGGIIAKNAKMPSQNGLITAVVAGNVL